MVRSMNTYMYTVCTRACTVQYNKHVHLYVHVSYFHLSYTVVLQTLTIQYSLHSTVHYSMVSCVYTLQYSTVWCPVSTLYSTVQYGVLCIAVLKNRLQSSTLRYSAHRSGLFRGVVHTIKSDTAECMT